MVKYFLWFVSFFLGDKKQLMLEVFCTIDESKLD